MTGVYVLLALVACTKKEAAKEAPPPPPAPDKTAAKAADPAPPPAPATAKTGPCELKIQLTATKLSYEGGGLKGELPWKPGTAPDASVFKPLAGTCTAMLLPTNDLIYQDVIAVMDAIIKVGLVDISLGDGAKTPAKAPKSTGTPDPGIKVSWGSDGSLTGTLTGPPRRDQLKSAPVIIMTKTEVMFAGKTVGKIGDADLSSEIEKALPIR